MGRCYDGEIFIYGQQPGKRVKIQGMRGPSSRRIVNSYRNARRVSSVGTYFR